MQMLYIFTAQVIDNIIPCGKDTLVLNEKPFDQKRIAKCSKDVLEGKVLGLSRLILR